MTAQDRELMRKIANATDAVTRDLQGLTQRVDHLEHHLHDAPEPPRHLRCTVVFSPPVPPPKRAAYLEQFQAELVSLFREYGVDNFKGTYEQQ